LSLRGLLHQLLPDFGGERQAGLPPADERLATAVLLAEMARADLEIDEAESCEMRRLLAERFSLDPASAGELVEQAARRAEQSTSLYRDLQVLVRETDYDARCELVELLWRVAMADGRLDPYEEQRLRKIAGLLFVQDDHFVRAKLRAIGEQV
jgi:Uncharacterized protein conserved in bacteria